MMNTTSRPAHRDPVPTTAEPGGPGRGRRRLRRIAVAALVAAIVAGAAGYAWLRTTSSVKVQGEPCADVAFSLATGVTTPEEELRSGICGTLDALVTSWNDADAAAYGAGFTADATYVAFTGTIYQGRDDIVAGHEALFTGLLEGTRLTVRYLDVRVTSDSTAVVLARGDTYKDDEPTEPTKVQTFTLVRDPSGRWLVATFHNTQRQPAMERFQFLLNPGSVPERER